MKRITALAVLIWAFGISCSALEVSAKSAVLYDPLTQEVVFEQNASERRGMASTTKIMTALVALELYQSEDLVEIKPAWCGIEGSSMYLRAGEKLSVSDLLHGLMLQSGNDAATALAGLYSGDPADFVAKMNEKAQELGLTDTSFENPSGLDGELHYTTALDMARLAAYAMENQTFRQIVGTKTAKIGQRYLKNHNKLLWMVDGVEGVKTGFTKACGRCLVSSVQRDGRRLIAVTLAASDDWNDHEKLYDFGFERFSSREVLKAGTCANLPVYGGVEQETPVYVNEGAVYSLTEEEAGKVTTVLRGPRMVYAPIRAGELYGELEVRLEGQVLCSLPAFYGTTIEQDQPERGFWANLWQTIKAWF